MVLDIPTYRGQGRGVEHAARGAPPPLPCPSLSLSAYLCCRLLTRIVLRSFLLFNRMLLAPETAADV